LRLAGEGTVGCLQFKEGRHQKRHHGVTRNGCRDFNT
jgi:hypothetical protein